LGLVSVAKEGKRGEKSFRNKWRRINVLWKKLKKGAKKDAEKFGGKGKRQYLCNRKSETDRWS